MSILSSRSGAMVIRGCGAVLGRVVGVRVFSTIHGASGPVRFNPQAPGTAKPTRRESREEAGVSYSRPLQRWKRAPKTDEEWGLLKLQEQKRHWNRQEEVEREVGEDQCLASAEMQRLKAEMQMRDSSRQSSGQLSRKREKILPVAEEGQGLSAGVSSSRTKHDEQDACPFNPSKLLHTKNEEISVTADLGRVSAVKKNQSFGKGLFYGDDRKLESLDSESSNWNRAPPTLKRKNQLQSSGLFYGDGRKFEGLLPDANDLFDDSLDAAKDKLFETPDTEVDKKIAQEKQAAKNYALRLLGTAPQTAHKLRQKLIGRNVSASVIQSTIVDLQKCGLQSDLEYAEAFARSRWRSSIWGPERLKQELRQRGVGPEDIEAAVQKVFTSSDEFLHLNDDSEDNEGRWGMTKEASDRLLEKARLQWRRGGNISAEARKRRMVGWLQRRGFNWSITSEILKSLEAQDRQ